jgi:hypothetical protein
MLRASLATTALRRKVLRDDRESRGLEVLIEATDRVKTR